MLEQKSPDSQAPALEQGSLFDQDELARLTVAQQEWETETLQPSMQRVPEQIGRAHV